MNSSLKVVPVKTRIFRKNESLADFICEHIPRQNCQEEMVLAVTSKIVSLAEGQLLATQSIEKQKLIQQEADHYLGEVGFGCHLTIKEGLFIPSAGIDESNSEEGHYILYPRDPFASVEKLGRELKKRWGLHKLGILMTDSHTMPLRRGVTGISLAHWGFRGLRDLIGSEDLFGRKLKMTTVNLADGMASAATLLMGEAAEACPLAQINMTGLVFDEVCLRDELKMKFEDDLYYPFFKDRIQHHGKKY